MTAYTPLATTLLVVCLALNLHLASDVEATRQVADDEHTAQIRAAEAQATYAFAQTLLSGAGLLGTLILLYFTKASLDAARDSINLTKVHQRAWMGVKSVDLVLPVAASDPTRLEVTFINSGATPAVNVVLATRLVRWPTRDKSVTDLVDPALLQWTGSSSTNLAVVLPGVSVSNHLVGPSSPGLNEVIRAGRGLLCFYGEVRYSDVFGDGHETSFAYWYNPDTNKVDAATSFNRAT